ncbi:MAG: hypothetical protein HQ575_07825 [Candidatus Omnitrophica bacterium]|nr:hypothetical protein [Candidatus Omnitrophota bacterium]
MKRIIPVFICTVLLMTSAVYAMGLSTTFGRVRVDNLMAGQRYSMQRDGDAPFIIKNTSNFELKLKMDVVIPSENELVEGYEAIPDAGWINVQGDSFNLPPESDLSTDIIITVPDDDIYKGKKYQVYIWSHTEGGAIAVGLKSKLLISIAE